MGGAEEDRSFLKQVRHMYKHAGLRVFTRGMAATGIRDAIFGLVFSVRKIVSQDKNDNVSRFAVGTLAAGVATVCSSPLNFVRNVAYAQSPEVPAMTWRRALRDLV